MPSCRGSAAAPSFECPDRPRRGPRKPPPTPNRFPTFRGPPRRREEIVDPESSRSTRLGGGMLRAFSPPRPEASRPGKIDISTLGRESLAEWEGGRHEQGAGTGGDAEGRL